MEFIYIIPKFNYLQRCSFYESLLLFILHGWLLFMCQSIVSFQRVLFGTVSLLQIVIRIIGFQSSDELTSCWFYERQDATSFGLSFAFYVPQIFLLSLLVNHEYSYDMFVGSSYANQIIDYLYFSFWLYLLAVTFLLFNQLVYQSKWLNFTILTGIWFAFYYGFYTYHFFYWLLAYSFGYLIFIGANFIKHTWSFGEYSSILLVLVTIFVFFYDNMFIFSKLLLVFDRMNIPISNQTSVKAISNTHSDFEWIKTLQLACGILVSNAFTIAITSILIYIRHKYKRYFLQIKLNSSVCIILIAIVNLLLCASLSTQYSLLTIFKWLILDFMSKQYRWIQLLWCCFMAISCIIYTCIGFFLNTVNVNFIPTHHYRNPDVCIRRKIFHFILCFTLMPLLCFDDQFTLLATTCLLSLFIVLELVRIYNADIFAQLYYRYIWYFLNEKDCGSVVVSHINLLVGASFPVWTIRSVTFRHKLNPRIVAAYRCILLNSGLVSVGIGDSVACIVGILFGNESRKIFDSNKTIVGMIASFLAQLITMLLLFCIKSYPLYDSLFQIIFSKHCLILIQVSVLSSILESLTTQNDNLMIPLVIFPIIAAFI